jgi:hypothetical protein
MSDLEQYNLQAFESCVGQMFAVSNGEASLDMCLVEALRTGNRNPDDAGHDRPFALLYLAPAECDWPQNLYRLTHDQLGTLEVFLVPVGPSSTSDGMLYEAVFN